MKDRHGNEAVPIQTYDQFRDRLVRKDWAEETYKEYSHQYGTRQSFERLHERGGFGIEEMIMLLVQRCQRLEKLIKND